MAENEPLRAQMVLSSRFENIEVAERSLVDLVEQAGGSGDDQYWLVTALREAMANAIRHGNQQQQSLKVKVEMTIEQQVLTLRVEDEGEGFVPDDSLPDPTDPENLLRPSGRGIFYMKQFMDQVAFEALTGGGTAVTMVRRLQPNIKRRSTEHEESDT